MTYPYYEFHETRDSHVTENGNKQRNGWPMDHPPGCPRDRNDKLGSKNQIRIKDYFRKKFR